MSGHTGPRSGRRRLSAASPRQDRCPRLVWRVVKGERRRPFEGPRDTEDTDGGTRARQRLPAGEEEHKDPPKAVHVLNEAIWGLVGEGSAGRPPGSSFGIPASFLQLFMSFSWASSSSSHRLSDASQASLNHFVSRRRRSGPKFAAATWHFFCGTSVASSALVCAVALHAVPVLLVPSPDSDCQALRWMRKWVFQGSRGVEDGGIWL